MSGDMISHPEVGVVANEVKKTGAVDKPCANLHGKPVFVGAPLFIENFACVPGVRCIPILNDETKLKVWLSAHIYFGLALVIIATLHSGFQIGWNIHSAAYILVLLTVASGIFGVFVYARYPKLMTKNRAGLSLDEMMGQISELDQALLKEGRQLPEELNTALLKAVRETYIGGNIVEKLSPIFSSLYFPQTISKFFKENI